jgi:septum formation protein
MNIILGSSSPRRKELFSLIHQEFNVVKPEIDESVLENELPLDYVERISTKKAQSLLHTLGKDDLLICADTTVALGKTILTKPEDHDHAVSMLEMLSGKTHSVITSITVIYKASDIESRMKTENCETEVTFRELTRKEIVEYLGLVEYQDKAGSYALQDRGSMLVLDVAGSHSNVIGFPLSTFYMILTHMGLMNKFLEE